MQQQGEHVRRERIDLLRYLHKNMADFLHNEGFIAMQEDPAQDQFAHVSQIDRCERQVLQP